MKRAAKKPTVGQPPEGKPTIGFLGILRFTPFFPVLATLIWALSGDFSGGSTSWSVLAVGLVIGAASLMVGGLLGFLFALPRMGQLAEGSESALVTNTNLEQVSDWLTKILVGIGLIELGRIGSGIGDLAESAVPGLGSVPGAQSFAVGLLIYSVVDGFLLGYLWTRIVVSARLKEAAEENVLNSPAPSPPPNLPPPPPGLKPPGSAPTPPSGGSGSDSEPAEPAPKRPSDKTD